MSKNYQASSKEIAHVTRVGARTTLPNGDVLHRGRTPESPDHEITVITRNNRVMSSSAKLNPLKKVMLKKRQDDAKAKAKQDLSASRKKAQQEKKRARSAQASNKQGNKTQR